MNGQMADVEAEEHVRLQLGQTVVPEPEIEDDSVGLSFERAHHAGDVRQIRVLAYYVQSGFLQGAGTGRDFGVRRAQLRYLCNAYTRHHTRCPNQCP